MFKVRGPLIDIYTSHACFLLLDAVGDEVNNTLSDILLTREGAAMYVLRN